MSDRSLLISTVTSLLASRPDGQEADAKTWDGALWHQLEESGLTLIGTPEQAGGQGGSIAHLADVIRVLGRSGCSAPLAETALISAWALAEAGLQVPQGALTSSLGGQASFTLTGSHSGHLVSGHASRVPYASVATVIVVEAVDEYARSWVVAIPAEHFQITPGHNLADEPRDDLTCVGAKVELHRAALFPATLDGYAGRYRGALARTIAMVGAMERAMELTLTYARDRTQFGKPLGKFQAIQQAIAQQAGELAAATAAMETAIEALVDGVGVEVAIAAAKIRAGTAAGVVTAVAHQVHGALGMTDEHPLHHATKRLWSWRDEYGSEAEWAITLGRWVANAGPEEFWPVLTSIPAPAARNVG